jgi:hypothetical protein
MEFLDGAFAQHLVHYGYGAIFLIVMIESAGIPMPGETILVGVAVYAGTRHALDIRFVIAAAAAGAIVGATAFALVADRPVPVRSTMAEAGKPAIASHLTPVFRYVLLQWLRLAPLLRLQEGTVPTSGTARASNVLGRRA